MAGKVGRPCKLTKKVQDRICEGIQLGLTYDLAAKYGGIHYATMREWIKKGDGAKAGPFREFREAINDAEAEAAADCMRLIRLAAHADTKAWTAAAWLMERRYPQMYGRRVQEIQGKDGEAISIKLEWPGANGDGE